MNETPPTFPPATGLVRRLAPIETCRLMGFPDDYLDVDGAATKDAPRYKACGNSWAVNCAEWVNARIERALRESGAVAPDAPIRYATTCSGVEAHSLSVGYTHANWQPRFFSEIEPFPCRVLAHRYPSVPNLGDMTKVDGHDWPLDVFSGGTPCQSVSVAGKRHGMAEGSGTRSSLAFHWLRIANETGAKISCWENVFGAFSTNGGRDFAWFVHRLTEAGWGVAWRVLDAQYVFSWTFPRAIPQRRRRIWLVAVRGGDWQMAARIMFERSRESGATPPVRVLSDGTVVDADDGADAAERRFLRFGATREADWVSVRDLDEVSQFGNVLYRGPMFKSPDLFGGCEDATPDNIDPQMLAALNGGGGVAVGDIVALLKVPAWNAGIERPWALRDAEANPLPAAYDGTVCGLSDVLLPWSDDLLRLVLSQRACEGILRRAKARGKELKAVLKTALEGQIACWTAGLLRDAKGKGNAAEEAEAEDAEAATHEEEEAGNE